MLQESLLCGCGASAVRGGFCAKCERRQRLSDEYFGGLREQALRRDGYRCQVCGEMDPALILVHHRRPGVDLLVFLLTMCRRCHVRIHMTRRPSFVFATFEFLASLWREVNPTVPEQRLLALAAEVRAYEQQALAFGEQE
jgi:hypothetical protein